MQKKPFYFSINSEGNLIIWMDTESIYLLFFKFIYILDHIDSFIVYSKKLSLEKIQSWGESRYFGSHDYL